MKIKIPSSYELILEEYLDDVNGLGRMLIHKKTGARVALISNEDDNKVFSIGFRTPPENSTGVAHILEHSVLCGSKEFPSKDPFVELAKGSLNTFLNAMTYSDRTIYPVASQNDKDFKNLMHVYLDAVFYPNIYKNEKIFQQEGWHYELEDEDDQLKINGVVYNEMKGVFSSPEQQLARMNQNSLFPDTAYSVESGGDPEFIPDLTYEEFLDFHRNYYHPSNSYIYLYGDMDFEERLTWLDKEYLSNFDRIEVDSEIDIQESFDTAKVIEASYSLGEEDEEGENTYLSYNSVIGSAFDNELRISFMVLQHVLLSSAGAPVKQALLDAGIGKDIMSNLSTAHLQHYITVVAKNAEEFQKEDFISVMRNSLEKIVEEGLDEKSLRAAINFYEFRYREADYGSLPRGLIYGLNVMGTWIYDEMKPFDYLKESSLYEFLKEKIGTGYYEDLIQKYLLDNKHSSLIILKPELGLGAKKDEAESKRLEAYKEGLSQKEKQEIIDNTKSLKEYQEEPSRKEDVEKIPILEREDINPKIEPLYNREIDIRGAKGIHHDVFTNDIAYIRVLFDVSEVPNELISYMSLLSALLGDISTKNYSYYQLSNEINIYTGGFSSSLNSYTKKDSQEFRPFFELGTKVLYENVPEAFRIIKEIVDNTVFEDSKRIKELLDEMRSGYQMNFNSSGHTVAVSRGMSYDSIHGLYREKVSGLDFYNFLVDILENYEEKKEMVIEKLKDLMEMIFVKDKILVSITADEEGKEKVIEELEPFIDSLNTSRPKELLASYKSPELVPQQLNEGFKTQSQVQYVARIGNLYKAGHDYTGALRVLRVILSYDYLWNNLRVKGGAYGCMCGFNGLDGDAYFVSYRDPNLRETNQVYIDAVDYVKNYQADERDITKSVIGTISGMDTPKTPQMKGRNSLSLYISGVTEEELQEERDEVLNVTLDDIRNLSDIIKSIIDAGSICVVGNEAKIEDEKDLFKEVKKLI